MKFRNYCIIIMGDTDNVVAEINKIAETKPNTLDAKGILIATFSSAADPRELTDYFKLNNRNFLIFDLNLDNSGFNIIKDDIHKGLFGFLDELNEENLRNKAEDLIQEISSTTVTRKSIKKNSEIEISLEDIDKMTTKDKNDLMNKLIDKGVKNLSNYDKKLLKKLSN
jgi:hypothetical protein